MKKLLLLLMVVGLVMAASGTASVLAQTTYELYADAKSDYPAASDFRWVWRGFRFMPHLFFPIKHVSTEINKLGLKPLRSPSRNH